ncbi:MAG TPA: hypothetical protein VGM88_32370 [Kofleriaceae bacterium]|jgi:hypothetical protein
MRTSIRASLVALAIAAPLGLALAKGPAENVGAHHPNLEAAQQLINDAYNKVEAAQRANEFDMGGHAQKAKDALKMASDEIKQAATAANKH